MPSQSFLERRFDMTSLECVAESLLRGQVPTTKKTAFLTLL